MPGEWIEPAGSASVPLLRLVLNKNQAEGSGGIGSLKRAGKGLRVKVWTVGKWFKYSTSSFGRRAGWMN